MFICVCMNVIYLEDHNPNMVLVISVQYFWKSVTSSFFWPNTVSSHWVCKIKQTKQTWHGKKGQNRMCTAKKCSNPMVKVMWLQDFATQRKAATCLFVKPVITICLEVPSGFIKHGWLEDTRFNSVILPASISPFLVDFPACHVWCLDGFF